MKVGRAWYEVMVWFLDTELTQSKRKFKFMLPAAADSPFFLPNFLLNYLARTFLRFSFAFN